MDDASPPLFVKQTLGNRRITALFIADANGDTKLDIFTAGLSGIYLYINDGLQINDENPLLEFTESTVSTTRASSLHVADVDGDLNLDLFATYTSRGQIYWYTNNEGTVPTFTAKTIYTSISWLDGITGGDMDGDGDQYLVSGSQNSGGVQWFENSGSRKPTFEARSIDGNSGNRVADITVADMDADGDLDVITAINTRQILWYENDGAESPGVSPHASAARGRTVFAADIDGDRRQDLLSIENNTIAWFPTTQRLVRHQENTVRY